MSGRRNAHHIQKDLSSLLQGDVHFDDVHRVLYSTAACIFQITPLGVVLPRTADDVSRLVKYAYDNHIPLTARGAGSGLAGQTLGEGIIIDFSKYMNRILEVNESEPWVRVQPGVILGDLNRELAGHGLWFPPDPSSADFCTLGGMIANNASGAHTVKYGATKDHVLEMTVILDNGEEAVVRTADASDLKSLRGRWGEIAQQVVPLVLKHSRIIHTHRPQAPKNSSGYNVWDALAGQEADLNKLIVGSEGTLAIVVEAKLRVIQKPEHRGLFRLFYDSVEHACDAAVQILEKKPAAVELVDRTMIDLIKGQVVEFQKEIPDGIESILLVEFDGHTEGETMDSMREGRGAIDATPGLRGVKEAYGSEFEDLWRVRRIGSPLLERVPGPLRTTRVIEDVCVDPRRVPEYIRELRKILDRFGLRGVAFGHAASGNIHVNVMTRPRSREDNQKMEALNQEVCDLVVRLKGTMSGEHGDGLLRAGLLRRFFGELYPVFEEIKKIFDPAGILNPGKKLAPAFVKTSAGKPEPYSFIPFLRGSWRWDADVDRQSLLYPQEETVNRCNGCGACRVYCPLFVEDHDERSTPRAKANLLMAVLEKRLDASFVTGASDMMSDLNVCHTCRLCLTACPAQVDAPQLADLTEKLKASD